jgi:hypothetical protein
VVQVGGTTSDVTSASGRRSAGTFSVGGQRATPARPVPDGESPAIPIAEIGPRTPPDSNQPAKRSGPGLTPEARDRILRHAQRQEEAGEPEPEDSGGEWDDDRIAQGLIAAGDDIDSRREVVPIIRKVDGVPTLFVKLTFRAIHEEENEACLNRSADQTQNPRTLQMERGEIRVWEYKCRVIYEATVGPKGRKFWDNPELRAARGVKTVWQVIDKTLSINEKNMCIDAIDRISETQIALAEPTKSGD